ncbi:hypothetical protein FOA52_008060 [Chlamydomonas sp. UWO 241]|nr:hypothetical protein FOA52_008060 [Chlamydomonas sp. UWO 241]
MKVLEAQQIADLFPVNPFDANFKTFITLTEHLSEMHMGEGASNCVGKDVGVSTKKRPMPKSVWLELWAEVLKHLKDLPAYQLPGGKGIVQTLRCIDANDQLVGSAQVSSVVSKGNWFNIHLVMDAAAVELRECIKIQNRRQWAYAVATGELTMKLLGYTISKNS